jgi:anti-sigma regulatory factor (Ser/Thr protein kinase)
MATESAASSIDRQVARISVAADREYLPAVLAFLREAVTRVGLGEADVSALERAVEEVATNVIVHGFPPGHAGAFDVVLARRPGHLVVAVEDQGLPFDWSALEAATGAGPAGPSLTSFADQVHFQNLGPRGNRVEIVKQLPFKHIDDYPGSEPPAAAAPAPLPPVSTQPVTLRAMTADDAIAVARCTYSVYGYTVPDEFLYFPDRIKEMLAGGLLEVCVAATPDDEIVACLTRELERPGGRVGYLGEGMVDPRFRGHRLMEQMLTFCLGRAAAQGLLGVYGEAVTVHPYSQKGNLALGFTETGVNLGDESSAVVFKDIDERAQSKRTATVIEYRATASGPGRVVYPPARHRDIIERIYQRGKFERTLAAPGDAASLPPHAQVGVQVFPQWGEALMRVTTYGADLVDVVRVRLRELCRRRIDWIAIELPLSHPGAALLCDGLERLGFFFAGVVPDLADDDVLRLQYLNEIETDVDSAHLASDFGRELFTYVVRAMEAAPEAGS